MSWTTQTFEDFIGRTNRLQQQYNEEWQLRAIKASAKRKPSLIEDLKAVKIWDDYYHLRLDYGTALTFDIRDDKLLLHKIYTLKSERGNGGATKLLQHLLEHAGNHNKTVVVDIAPFEWLDKEDPKRFVTTGTFKGDIHVERSGIRKDKVRKFYEDFGFILLDGVSSGFAMPRWFKYPAGK
jgi:GNAT superfamily N-acetyltransferase